MKKKMLLPLALSAFLAAGAFNAPVFADEPAPQLVVPAGKSAWETSTEVVKTVSSSDGAYTVSANYTDLYYGTGRSLILDLKANSVSGEVKISSVTVQRKVNGKWVKAAADIKAGRKISRTSLTAASPSSRITITPDLYFKKAAAGEHRVRITLKGSDGKARTLSYSFNMISNVDVENAGKVYDPVSVKKISFKCTLNTECELFPEVNELYYKKGSKWVLVKPRDGEETASATETVSSGTYTSVLDLTRYNTEELISGKYKVYIGDDTPVEFTLRRPVDIKAVQVRTNDGSTMVQLRFTNRSGKKITVSEYTKLWKANTKSGKWASIAPVGSISENLSVSSGKFRTKNLDVTSVFGTLPVGSYRLKVTTSSGESTYAYFDIVEGDEGGSQSSLSFGEVPEV